MARQAINNFEIWRFIKFEILEVMPKRDVNFSKNFNPGIYRGKTLKRRHSFTSKDVKPVIDLI